MLKLSGFPKLMLVTVLTEIDNLADRWVEIGGDFDKVEPISAGELESLVDGVDAVTSVWVNYAHSQCANSVVYSDSWLPLSRGRLSSFCDCSLG